MRRHFRSQKKETMAFLQQIPFPIPIQHNGACWRVLMSLSKLRHEHHALTFVEKVIDFLVDFLQDNIRMLRDDGIYRFMTLVAFKMSRRPSRNENICKVGSLKLSGSLRPKNDNLLLFGSP